MKHLCKWLLDMISNHWFVIINYSILKKFGPFPSNMCAQNSPNMSILWRYFQLFFVLTPGFNVDWNGTFKMRRMGNYNHNRIFEDDFSLSTSALPPKNKSRRQIVLVTGCRLKDFARFYIFRMFLLYIFYIVFKNKHCQTLQKKLL